MSDDNKIDLLRYLDMMQESIQKDIAKSRHELRHLEHKINLKQELLERQIIELQEQLSKSAETIIENKIKLTMLVAGGGAIGGGAIGLFIDTIKKIL